MSQPIEVFFWPTPNGLKISIALEEMELPYVLKAVNINRGDQFRPEFLAISPNNRMPAIVDPEGPGGTPISIFESGAILLYLGRKSGKLYPTDERARTEVEQWLVWQVSNLGPMSGQASHFKNYAPKLVDNDAAIAYARHRYVCEVNRLYGVMDHRLAEHEYLAGDYSIADIACWPWLRGYATYEQKLEDFRNLQRWYEQLKARPALRRGVEAGQVLKAKTLAEQTPEELKQSAKILFGQTAASVEAATKQR